jgi:hypothetical protein
LHNIIIDIVSCQIIPFRERDVYRERKRGAQEQELSIFHSMSSINKEKAIIRGTFPKYNILDTISELL